MHRRGTTARRCGGDRSGRRLHRSRRLEAKQAISEGGENAQQALAEAEKTCKSSVSQLPAGQAQAALTRLCDAISAAE